MPKLWKVALGTVGVGVLLAALLFPIFQKVPENVHHPATQCASDMKQLGLALIQYTQDNDEMLPSAAKANGHGWREDVYPYVKSTAVYCCPDDSRGSGHTYSSEDVPKSYGANAAVVTGASISAFSNPIQTIMVIDTRGYDGEEWNMVSPTFLPGTGRSLYAHLPLHAFYEHPDGVLNVLFADGHVKRMKAETTLAPINSWTRDNAPFTGQDLANAQAILRHVEKE